MTDDMVRIDMKVPSDKFDQLVDFVDEFKDVRRDSKQFYGRKFFDLAYELMLEKEEERQVKAKEFRKIQDRMRQVLNQ